MKGREEQTSAVSLVLPGSSIVENKTPQYLAQKNFVIRCLFKFWNSLSDKSIYTINTYSSKRKEADDIWWISPSVAVECGGGGLDAEGEVT